MDEAPTIRTVCATLMDMSRRFLLGELKKGGLVTELRQLASHLEGGADDTEGAAAAAAPCMSSIDVRERATMLFPVAIV